MATITKDLGPVTAYAYAVAGGYTGTEEEFEELLGNIAVDLEQIENLSVTVTTLPEGSSATASYSDGVLSLGIPKGDTGNTGATPDFRIGTVTTGAAGTDASASITGTAEEPVLNLTIPRGDPGEVTQEEFDDLAADVTDLNGALQQMSDTKASAIFEETSGSIASFADGADSMPIKELVVNIEPVQSGSGDPSPTNVRLISGWTGANITRCGKNLFDLANFDSSKLVAVKNTSDQTRYAYLYPFTAPKITGSVKVKSGETLSGGAYINIGGAKEGILKTQEQLVTPSVTSKTATKTTPSDEKICLAASSIAAYTYNLPLFEYLQLEVGDTATTPEPYSGETKTLTWADEAGTVYGGYVDAIKGKLVVANVRFDMGQLSWSVASSGGVSGFTASPTGKDMGAFNVLCEVYKTGVSGHGWGANMVDKTIVGRSTNNNIYVRDDDYNDATLFKASVNGKYVVCGLATPVEYDLTDVLTVPTLYGINNIFADCGSIKSVLYPADTKLYIDSALGTNEDNMIADHLITSGEVFSTGSKVFEATGSIAVGATIIPGSNCAETSIIAQINALKS